MYRFTPANFVVKLNKEGRIVDSLHDPSQRVVGGLLSQVTEVNRTLYLGSFLMPYAVRVDLA